MYRYLLFTLIVAGSFSSCGNSGGEDKITDWSKPDNSSGSTKPASYKVGDTLWPADSMKLVWADEFNTGTMVDTKDWTYEKGHVRNDEIQYYTEARPENCRIDGGQLIFTGRKETPSAATGNEAITSASIITNKKHSWKYGRFEVRCKVPPGKGPWPAFWAKGDSQNTGAGWPNCGEIDIMEYAAKNPNEMIQNAIYGTGSGSAYTQQVEKVQSATPYHTAFHVYTLDWTANQLAFAIDNKVTHVVDLTKLTFNPFNQPFSILLNLSLGASTERTLGGKLDESCLPVEFRVDYVRIYQ
ncbi:MAG: glycoside hydrolase family 16 protein [Tannerella sp.]|jgi:beta-glucanase (GH16 family)|nr:glycoside hydrolase family 16 protein [Tannerella sp.]